MPKRLDAAMLAKLIASMRLKPKRKKKTPKRPDYMRKDNGQGEGPEPYTQGEGNEDSVGGFGPNGYGV